MKTSADIESICAALSAAQGEFPSISKSKTLKTNSYSYKYADLSDIFAACMPIMAKHGLAILQTPSFEEGRVKLITRLLHKSGQWFESELSMRPAGDTPQAIGSATTYARRYSISSILGIAADDDDDGESAMPEKGQPKENQTQVSNPPLVDDPVIKLLVAFKPFGITRQVLEQIINRPLHKATPADFEQLGKVYLDLKTKMIEPAELIAHASVPKEKK